MPAAFEGGGGGGGGSGGGGGVGSGGDGVPNTNEPQVVTSDTHRRLRGQINVVGQSPDLKPPSYQSQFTQPEAHIGSAAAINSCDPAPPPYSQSSPPAPLIQESIELGPPPVPQAVTTSGSELDDALETVSSSIASISSTVPTSSAPAAPKY